MFYRLKQTMDDVMKIASDMPKKLKHNQKSLFLVDKEEMRQLKESLEEISDVMTTEKQI